MEIASSSTWVWSRHVFRLQKVFCPIGRKHWSKSQALQLQRDLIVAYSESGAPEARDIKLITDSRVPLRRRQPDKLTAWQHWASLAVWQRSSCSRRNSLFSNRTGMKQDSFRFLDAFGFQGQSFRKTLRLCCKHTQWPAPSCEVMASLDSNECSLNTGNDCWNRRYRDTELLER